MRSVRPPQPTLTRPDRSTLRITQRCALGGILSPLLANLALSVLDEHFAEVWQRHRNPTARKEHRRRGGATYRLVRYADDFVVMVSGTREQAESLWEQVAAVLAPVRLRLALDKTRIVHIDEGFDFLGYVDNPAMPTGRMFLGRPPRAVLSSIFWFVGIVVVLLRHDRLMGLSRW